MKITTLVMLGALALSNTCFAKEKMIKDPFGTSCTSADLMEIASISGLKTYSELPNFWKNFQNNAQNKSKKFVALQARKKKDGTQEELMQMERDIPGDSYAFSDFFYMQASEAKKLDLKVGDKKYCLGSFFFEGGDRVEF